jgi:hypothetical protein
MNAPTLFTAFNTADRAGEETAAARYRSARRRHFEALLLRSFDGMRARSRAA